MNDVAEKLAEAAKKKEAYQKNNSPQQEEGEEPAKGEGGNEPEQPKEEEKNKAPEKDAGEDKNTEKKDVKTGENKDKNPDQPSESSSKDKDSPSGSEASADKEPKPTQPRKDEPKERPLTKEELTAKAKELYGVEPEDFQKFVKGELKEQPEYSDDIVRELNDYISRGGDAKNFYEFKLTDYGNMDDRKAVETYYKRQFPELSDDQINRKIDRKFKLNSEYHDEEEVQEGKDELAFEAAQGRRWLEEQRKNYDAPFPEPIKPQSKEKDEAKEEGGMTPEEQERFAEDLRNSMNNMQKVQIGDFEYTVDENLKNKVAQQKMNIAENFVKEDGSFDFDAYNLMQVISADRESFVDAILQEGRSKAYEEVKQSRNNANYSPDKQDPGQVDASDEENKKKMIKMMQRQNGSGLSIK